MRLIGKPILEEFKRAHPDACEQVKSWEKDVEKEEWKTPHNLKSRYPKASLLGKSNTVFNICWNKYRLWVKVAYETGIVFVKKIGTHEEYDKWDIE